ncbi:MAG: CRISPR-associated endonuclease Cas2 [Eggerthellaceae bacterium]
MRLVLFFDLPVETERDRKEYRQFRKFLIHEGYLMLQESVYSKLVTTDVNASGEIARLRKHRPPSGLVQVLKVTEKQFETMVYITGNRESYEEIDTLEELIVL